MMVGEPKTLGFYRDWCAAVGGEKCKAVALLDAKIKKNGRDDVVIADESQMLMLLGPLLMLSEE